MSDAVQQFIALTKAAVLKQNPQNQRAHDTQMLWCPACKEQTPHERALLGWQCLFAYSHKLSERGQGWIELLFWLALILIVLFVVLKDVPW